MNKMEMFETDIEKETDVKMLELMLEGANEYVAYYEKLAEKHTTKVANYYFSKNAELFKQKASAIEERLNSLK